MEVLKRGCLARIGVCENVGEFGLAEGMDGYGEVIFLTDERNIVFMSLERTGNFCQNIVTFSWLMIRLEFSSCC